MFSQGEKAYYNRQFILSGFGPEKQELLKNGSVLVVGAGGLGCPALLYLAGAGIGRIGIIDGDVVDASNLHRQVLYTKEDIGANKAYAASKRLLGLNEYIDIEVYEEPLTPQNAEETISGYDVVLDGTDNFATRYLINDACVQLGLPFVYGAIHKYEGQLSVFNYEEGPTYRCLFPDPPEPGTVPGCSEVGVIGVLPGLIGTRQAMEVIKILSGIGEVCSGQLILTNALDNNQFNLDIQPNPENQNVTIQPDYEVLCNTPSIPEIDAGSAKEKIRSGKVFLLDVREPHEVAQFNIGGVNVPAGQLDKSQNQLPGNDEEILVICQSGSRSQQVVKKLLERGYSNAVSVRGGLMEWSN